MLKIKNNWNYKGSDRWDWEIFIDDQGTGELNQIDFVEYILHPTFRNPIRKSLDRESGFKIKTNGWGTFPIKVIINKLSGDKLSFAHDLVLKYDPKQGTT